MTFVLSLNEVLSISDVTETDLALPFISETGIDVYSSSSTVGLADTTVDVESVSKVLSADTDCPFNPQKVNPTNTDTTPILSFLIVKRCLMCNVSNWFLKMLIIKILQILMKNFKTN